MRHVRVFVVACVALSLLLVPSTQAVADTFSKDGNGPWLLGERVHMTDGCWTEGAVGRSAPRLQAIRKGKWSTIAVAKMVNDALACTDDDFPLRANFYFTPKDRGVNDPESRGYWLTVRVLSRTVNERYPVLVYATARDWDLDWADKNCYGYSYTFDEARQNDCLTVLGDPWKAWFAENVTNSPGGQYDVDDGQ